MRSKRWAAPVCCSHCDPKADSRGHSLRVLRQQPRRRPAYTGATEELRALLAAEGIGVVYGGGGVGLMGKLADAVLAAVERSPA